MGWLRKRGFAGQFAVMWLLAVVSGRGQTRGVAPGLPTAVAVELRALTDEAAVEFVGRVTSVSRRSDDHAASGVVEVTFAVETAVRGTSDGGVYVLREWAGLWDGGDQRYRVGERLLMLLHAPGPAGLSSPVGGMDGAIPVRDSADVSGTVSEHSIGGMDAAGQVDLRWIAARAARAVYYRIPSMRVPAVHAGSPSVRGREALQGAQAEAPPTAAVWAKEVASRLPETPPATLSGVVSMLRSWQGEASNAP